MWICNNWRDYEVLDASDGEKLERWGGFVLIRPDPTVIWSFKTAPKLWEKADARYIRSQKGGGSWDFKNKIDTWSIGYKDLRFNLKPFNFKHTGIFPEQAVNWDWFSELIKDSKREINVLNLFAYTGGATMAAASAGARVCHVDSARGMVLWAKENARLCKLGSAPIRYIVDDCIKFVGREIRRGAKYDAIIMDPPSYGRGPNGEVFKIEDTLYDLCVDCVKLLSDKPLFFLINSYTTILSPSLIENILNLSVGKKFKGKISCDEIGLRIKDTNIVLPCGVSGRWQCE